MFLFTIRKTKLCFTENSSFLFLKQSYGGTNGCRGVLIQKTLLSHFLFAIKEKHLRF